MMMFTANYIPRKAVTADPMQHSFEAPNWVCAMLIANAFLDGYHDAKEGLEFDLFLVEREK